MAWPLGTEVKAFLNLIRVVLMVAVIEKGTCIHHPSISRTFYYSFLVFGGCG